MFTRMKTSMRARHAVVCAAGAAFVAMSAGVGGASAGQGLPPPTPMPPASDFVGKVDNKYMPLKPGTTLRYRGTEDGQAARDRFAVTDQTKTILGVQATVVKDVAILGGQPEEKTFDWFAQDNRGNVWYLGEDSFDRVNGEWVRNDGSWEAGVDGAKPGIVMEVQPKVGDTYRQEYYPGHAEDVGRVLSTNASASVPAGKFDHVVKTRDWSPLEPGIVEHKYFAPGVGEVRSVKVKGGSEVMELVNVTHKK